MVQPSQANGHRQEQRTFCFLSQLLGRKVFGPDRRLLGKIEDLLATVTERYPEIESIVLRRKAERVLIPATSRGLLVIVAEHELILSAEVTPARYARAENQFLVREALYDKQIVDVNGAKVERVNDVQVLVYAEKPFLVHVDVGFTGLTRRLGLEGGIRSLARAFGRPIKDELIGWKFVQTFPESGTPTALQVTLRQEQIKQLHAGELADIIEELDRDERLALVRSIGPEDAADALEEADLAVQTSVIRDLDTELAADILEEMEPAVAADVIEELPADAQKSIMAAMEDVERAQLELLAQAEEETAASLMTVDFVACSDALTAADALAEVRRQAEEVEYITYLYCVDDEKRLRGVVSLRDLILSEPGVLLAEIMHQRLATLGREDDWDTVADQFWKLRFKAIPVVDPEGRVEGIVTFRHSFEELIPHYHKLAS
jgi:CBS domain-containing protein/sporulation protein YlmC with PRC-barrel domain